MDLNQSLEELQRLGLHLNAGDAAKSAQRRRVRLNTRTYPLTRALGFQLLIVVVMLHNAVVFDRMQWGPVLTFTLVAEAYVLLSWLALRRWFVDFPTVRGWDLSDLFFLADLVVWAGAIRATGGPLSLLWIVPVLRVADYQTVDRVWVLAHVAPLSYALAAFWPPRPVAAGLDSDLLKMALLYAAGMYIAWAGIPARRYREQRKAAMTAGGALLGRLAERTERLDAARRSRSALLGELGAGVRTSLIEIVGFSRFLLRSETPRSESENSYLVRIHEESQEVLRALAGLAASPEAPLWPRVSLSGIIQAAAAEEAAETDEWREAAVLDLPEGDIEVRADGARLKALLRHTLSACRYFRSGPPRVELRVDPGTGLAEAVVMRCPAMQPAGGLHDDLFNPFAESAVGNQREMTARLELSIARSMGQSLGYDIAIADRAPGTELTLRLR